MGSDCALGIISVSIMMLGFIIDNMHNQIIMFVEKLISVCIKIFKLAKGHVAR